MGHLGPMFPKYSYDFLVRGTNTKGESIEVSAWGVADQIAIAMDMESKGWTDIELIRTIDERAVVE